MTDILTLVEGATDKPYAEAIVRAVGHRAEPVIVKRGHGSIDNLLPRWNDAGNRRAALVLRDLDPMPRGTSCVPEAVAALLNGPLRAECVAVRLPVRELESWILADEQGVSDFFGLRAPLPTDPDLLSDPKKTLVDLCRKSVLSKVRRGMVPRVGSGRAVGPDYEALVIEFGARWDPLVAARRSPSLARTIARLQDLSDRSIW